MNVDHNTYTGIAFDAIDLRRQIDDLAVICSVEKGSFVWEYKKLLRLRTIFTEAARLWDQLEAADRSLAGE